MERIQELSQELKKSKEMVQDSRNGIQITKNHIAKGGLNVIALQEMKDQHMDVAKHLQNIKKIITMRRSLQERINVGDFVKAISLCLECSNLINEYSRFDCVKKMDIKAENNLVKKKLDAALGDSCRNQFNPAAYQRTIDAFRLIRKPNRVVVRLNKHFSESITAAVYNTTLSHVLMSPENYQKAEDIRRLKFERLTSKLGEEPFLSCFKFVLEHLVDIMFAHHNMVKWHKEQESPEKEGSDYYKEIGLGIEKFSKTMWDEMQRILSTLCSQPKLCSFKFENFLIVLDYLSIFLEIGEDFGGDSAHKLRNLVKSLSKAYYETFHQSRMDELKSMLSDEMWTKYPIPLKHRITDIKEIRTVLTDKIVQTSTLTSGAAEEQQRASRFLYYLKEGNPFSRKIANTKKEEPQANNEVLPKKTEEEENSELTVQYVDEFNGRSKGNTSDPNEEFSSVGPLVCASTMKLVQYIGKYLSMMKTLSNVSWEICQGAFNITSLYIFHIMNHFGPNPESIQGIRISNGARTSMQQIANRLITKTPDGKQAKNQLIKLNESLDLSATNLYGLMNRSVAAESLLYVKQTFDILKPYFQNYLPKAQISQLTSYYTTTINYLPELRSLVYKEICQKLVPSENIIKLVQEVNWNMKDIPVKHSSYVDNIDTLLQGFKRRLPKSFTQAAPQIHTVMWEMMISHIFDCVVEGWAINQCSNEGRAMMGIDFQNMQIVIQKTSELQPVPHLKFAEAYIKAFYLMDNDFEKWIQEHREYTNKQLLALVNSGKWDIRTKQRCSKLLQ